MNVVLEKDAIILEYENQKMIIHCEEEYMYISSNDVNGLTVKSDDKLWKIINNFFSQLIIFENNNSLRKYQDYLVRIESEENFSKLVFAKVFDDFVFSVISPKDEIVKINIKDNDVGKMLLSFYNNLLMYAKDIYRITNDQYTYTLTRKNVIY